MPSEITPEREKRIAAVSQSFSFLLQSAQFRREVECHNSPAHIPTVSLGFTISYRGCQLWIPGEYFGGCDTLETMLQKLEKKAKEILPPELH